MPVIEVKPETPEQRAVLDEIVAAFNGDADAAKAALLKVTTRLYDKLLLPKDLDARKKLRRTQPKVVEVFENLERGDKNLVHQKDKLADAAVAIVLGQDAPTGELMWQKHHGFRFTAANYGYVVKSFAAALVEVAGEEGLPLEQRHVDVVGERLMAYGPSIINEAPAGRGEPAGAGIGAG